MDLTERSTRYAALGDERRLLIVDELVSGDRTFSELAGLVSMSGNLLAHHLEVLDEAGLIERRISEGDHRRRYVSLRWDNLPVLGSVPEDSESVAFVCSHNSARSQFASALWTEATGTRSTSAGSEPAERVHPKAVRVASEFGVDLSNARPSGYEALPRDTDLIVSVCDRAKESGVPEARQHKHWSIPDPVLVGTLTAFRSAFGEIARRMEHLTGVSL